MSLQWVLLTHRDRHRTRGSGSAGLRWLHATETLSQPPEALDRAVTSWSEIQEDESSCSEPNWSWETWALPSEWPLHPLLAAAQLAARSRRMLSKAPCLDRDSSSPKLSPLFLHRYPNPFIGTKHFPGFFCSLFPPLPQCLPLPPGDFSREDGQAAPWNRHCDYSWEIAQVCKKCAKKEQSQPTPGSSSVQYRYKLPTVF